jgi:hypothetical protein
MISAGFPEEQIEEARKRSADVEECEVWPENWRAVRYFVRLGTQWRVGGMGDLIGLDYAAVESALRMLAVQRSRWSSLFKDFQVMEAAAVDYLREKQSDK